MNRLLVIIALNIILFSTLVMTQNQPLPVDKTLITGTLENGVKYYIKQNKKPQNRAELRFVVFCFALYNT